MTNPTNDDTPAQLSSEDIGTTIGLFMSALGNLGRAQQDWHRCQNEANAAQLESASLAVDTAMEMVGLAVGTGTVQTRAEVEAWRERRKLALRDLFTKPGPKPDPGRLVADPLNPGHHEHVPDPDDVTMWDIRVTGQRVVTNITRDEDGTLWDEFSGVALTGPDAEPVDPTKPG